MKKKYAIIFIVLCIIASTLFYFFVIPDVVGPVPNDELKNEFENYLIDFVENMNLPDNYAIRAYVNNNQNIFCIESSGIESKLILNQDSSYSISSCQSYFSYYFVSIFISLVLGFFSLRAILMIIIVVIAAIKYKDDNEK